MNEYEQAKLNEESWLLRMMYDNIGYEMSRPSTIYKPRIFIDGDMWCALYGENLQDGVAGFGKSPQKAFENFDKEWHSQLPEASPTSLSAGGATMAP